MCRIASSVKCEESKSIEVSPDNTRSDVMMDTTPDVSKADPVLWNVFYRKPKSSVSTLSNTSNNTKLTKAVRKRKRVPPETAGSDGDLKGAARLRGWLMNASLKKKERDFEASPSLGCVASTEGRRASYADRAPCVQHVVADEDNHSLPDGLAGVCERVALSLIHI